MVIHSDRTGPDSGAIFSACTLRVGCPGICEVRSAGPQAGRLAAYLDGGPACASVGALTLRAGLAHVPLGPNSSFLHHTAHNIGKFQNTPKYLPITHLHLYKQGDYSCTDQCLKLFIIFEIK